MAARDGFDGFAAVTHSQHADRAAFASGACPACCRLLPLLRRRPTREKLRDGVPDMHPVAEVHDGHTRDTHRSVELPRLVVPDPRGERRFDKRWPKRCELTAPRASVLLRTFSTIDEPAESTLVDRDEELARLWQADPIGSHPDCVSSFGVYDLSGNVDEWTDNLADDPGTDRPSTLNGGYWGPVRNTCRLTTKSHGPTFTFYQVGFRCCADTSDGVATAAPKPFIEREGG